MLRCAKHECSKTAPYDSGGELRRPHPALAAGSSCSITAGAAGAPAIHWAASLRASVFQLQPGLEKIEWVPVVSAPVQLSCALRQLTPSARRKPWMSTVPLGL